MGAHGSTNRVPGQTKLGKGNPKHVSQTRIHVNPHDISHMHTLYPH
jgi:hypothetical protein